MSDQQTLAQWLAFITASNPYPDTVVLGLARVQAVISRMGWSPPTCPVVVIAGTNGKGSCVASLAAIYHSQGYRVGTFTSPWLFKYNEMVTIAGANPSDTDFMTAFAKIAQQKQELVLTPFEYHTLAAIELLQQQQLDVWLLEVGLGGRLDAVNCFAADVAVITSVALDHMAYLGNTREDIAAEKAGILRPKRPVVCGALPVPAAILNHATQLSSPLYLRDSDFSYQVHAHGWQWSSKKHSYLDLPLPCLAIANVATALMVIELLVTRLPVSNEAIVAGVATAKLPARCQVIEQESLPVHILDVAHNPAALAMLAQKLLRLKTSGCRVRLVFSMLADKDIVASMLVLAAVVDAWYVAPLTVTRGASQQILSAAVSAAQLSAVTFYQDLGAAYYAALHQATMNDIIVICGSFHTVAAVANVAPNLKTRLVAATLCTRR
jgi:dihydrofolate synthase/folylpolyglutamate synthase